jgi:hypothetical protein
MNRPHALFVVSSVEEQLGKRERQEGSSVQSQRTCGV